MGDFEGLPETRRRGLEKMEQVYGFDMTDGAGDFFRYTADHLFADIWNRPGLSDRDRRLILIGMLTGQGAADDDGPVAMGDHVAASHIYFVHERERDGLSGRRSLDRAAIDHDLLHSRSRPAWQHAYGVARMHDASGHPTAVSPESRIRTIHVTHWHVKVTPVRRRDLDRLEMVEERNPAIPRRGIRATYHVVAM